MKGSDTIIPVVVINWNGLDDTIECMDALLKQSWQAYRIYLVDNGSDGGEGRILEQRYSAIGRVEVVLYPENFGFTKASNLVFTRLLEEIPELKYIALCNNDAVADHDWLERLVMAADESGAAMLSSKMLYYYDPSKMDNAGHMMLNTGEILPIGHMQESHKFDQPFDNFGACAGASLYSSAMLEDIGFFDPFFSTGYEDAELGVRAVVSGYRSVFVPDARIRHKVSRSLQKIKDQSYIVRIQRAIFYSYFKLMPAGFLLLNIPVIGLRYILIFLIDLLFLRWSALQFHYRSISQFTRFDLEKALKARKEFSRERKRVGSFAIMTRVRFFLPVDIKRFFRYVVQGKKSTFDIPAE